MSTSISLEIFLTLSCSVLWYVGNQYTLPVFVCLVLSLAFNKTLYFGNLFSE